MFKKLWRYGCLIFSGLVISLNAFAGAWLPTKAEHDADADGIIDSIDYST